MIGKEKLGDGGARKEEGEQADEERRCDAQLGNVRS